MKYFLTKKMLIILVLIFGFLSFATLILGIGGGGVLNDLDSALKTMEELEKNNRLNNPPEYISDYLKKELSLLKNSAELKEYIKHTEKWASTVEMYLLIFSVLFLIFLFLRIFLSVFLMIRTKLNRNHRKQAT